MRAEPIFEHEIAFAADAGAEVLRAVPAAAGIVALLGHASSDKPFLMKSANLRRRVQRLLEPVEGQTKRLNLRTRVARIAWRATGSEFESLLLLHKAYIAAFGAEEARRRMRLSTPYTVRYAVENRFPRIYVTNHLRRRSLSTTFGPFASRFTAERYCEAVEEQFVIRRCYLELHPSPDDPGCIYGEMHKCMAPCQVRCTDEEYRAECERVLEFLKTRGGSRVGEIEAERDRLSAEMEFEAAAATHARAVKVKAAASEADELVQPLSEIRAVLLMPCGTRDVPEVAVFLFADGCFHGPERVSMLGVRLAKEQAAVGSSLFAQPMMVAAVPLEEATGAAASDASTQATQGEEAKAALRAQKETDASAEERMAAALVRLEDGSAAEDLNVLSDHLALLKRWYYRPEKQRVGAVFQRERDAWPVRRMVRAAAKVAGNQQVSDPATQQVSESTSQRVSGLGSAAESPG